MGQLRSPQSGGVEHHQQSAMERRVSGSDESLHLFLTEKRWQVNGVLRMGGLGNAPGFLERLDVEEAQCRQALCDRAR